MDSATGDIMDDAAESKMKRLFDEDVQLGIEPIMQMASIDMNQAGSLQRVVVPRMVGITVSNLMGETSMVCWENPKKGKEVTPHKTLHDGLKKVKLGMTLRAQNLSDMLTWTDIMKEKKSGLHDLMEMRERLGKENGNEEYSLPELIYYPVTYTMAMTHNVMGVPMKAYKKMNDWAKEHDKLVMSRGKTGKEYSVTALINALKKNEKKSRKYYALQSTTSARTPVLYFLDAFVSPNLSKLQQGHETSKLFRLASNTEQFVNMYTDWIIFETHTKVDRAAFKRSVTPFFEQLLARRKDQEEEEEEEEEGMLTKCQKNESNHCSITDETFEDEQLAAMIGETIDYLAEEEEITVSVTTDTWIPGDRDDLLAERLAYMQGRGKLTDSLYLYLLSMLANECPRAEQTFAMGRQTTGLISRLLEKNSLGTPVTDQDLSDISRKILDKVGREPRVGDSFVLNVVHNSIAFTTTFVLASENKCEMTLYVPLQHYQELVDSSQPILTGAFARILPAISREKWELMVRHI